MSMSGIELSFKFVGGLGMFLYGMNIMADGLEKSAGDKVKNLLKLLTNNRFLAVLVGAAITAVIQSSSATTVMVVGFVNAGIMQLGQAVGVIMGANIGTTITAWIVSMSEWAAFLKPEFLAPLIIGICVFTILFSKDEKKITISEIGVGFGILFIGLSFMSGAIGPYRDAPIFAKAFTLLGRNPLLGILAGTVVTGIIQSSSASVGILQTLAMNGVVNWQSAIFITLGQNIGTCVTAMISSVGASKIAKRAAVIHLLFNVMGALIFGIIMFFVFLVNKELASSPINSVEISIFHTVFNISNTLILLPFADKLVTLSGAIVKKEAPEAEAADEEKLTLRHLDQRILESPSFAVENAILEVVHMGNVTGKNVELAFEAVRENDLEKCAEVHEAEITINKMEKLITEYLIKISNLSLTEKQHKIVKDLFYTISDIERVGDHAENIAEFGEYKVRNGIEFSETATRELDEIMYIVLDCYRSAIDARETENTDSINSVIESEDKVDTMEEALREKHIQRLSEGTCQAGAGVAFLDIISNLERISDHSLNIALYVKDELAK